MQQVNIKKAWDLLESHKNSTYQVWAAVIDTGVDMEHPDLKSQLLKKYSVDVTESGMPLLEDVSRQYTTSHGTHVAGILAARTNNSAGIAGWGLRLYEWNLHGGTICGRSGCLDERGRLCIEAG